MQPNHEGPDDPGKNPAARRQRIEAALARAAQHRDRAHAWGDVRLVARYQAEMRHQEAALATLDATTAAGASDAPQP